MHIAPFIFEVKNNHAEVSFMGYLSYQNSRRDKTKTRVTLNSGAVNELIGIFDDADLMAKCGSYEIMFAKFLCDTGYDEEYFGASLSFKNADEFRDFLKNNGATLRFW